MESTKTPSIELSGSSIGLILLRIFIGLRLVYGVTDNVFSWKHMLTFSEFLKSFHFPIPLVSAVVSVYLQFFCGILILLGYKTKIASFIMVVNFLIAIIFVHIKGGDSIEVMTPALAMLFGSACLLFTGSGEIALDGRK